MPVDDCPWEAFPNLGTERRSRRLQRFSSDHRSALMEGRIPEIVYNMLHKVIAQGLASRVENILSRKMVQRFPIRMYHPLDSAYVLERHYVRNLTIL